MGLTVCFSYFNFRWLFGRLLVNKIGPNISESKIASKEMKIPVNTEFQCNFPYLDKGLLKSLVKAADKASIGEAKNIDLKAMMESFSVSFISTFIAFIVSMFINFVLLQFIQLQFLVLIA